MKIFLGADHAGFKLKESIKKILSEAGYNINDQGNIILDSNDDYPDYSFAVSKKVIDEEDSRGIIICGSGQGACIAANKMKGIRGAVISNIEEAIKSREHNDSNILCLSGWYLHEDEALAIIQKWLETPFSNEERHIRRLKKISDIEL